MMETGRKPVSVAPKNRKLIWKEIRELKTFTTKDIELRTKILGGTVYSYLKALVKSRKKADIRSNVYTADICLWKKIRYCINIW